ncbi:hypothetical protein E1B28_013091 [Marasmius oreades]|uniref:Uncharacterized protein n=1 Tax=Marasmius oreades TaxID=181124 RepID=A0A9P7UMM2_9AGAR|nr:uncharacterized protein E1B28_013091 [Marasmius oreades]KAG7087110.1 hypothetical protein E1B28_013091 [Marasmius oreades]
MLLAASLLSFVIPIQRVWALNISFPSPPTAAQDNTFLWTRDREDPGRVWARTQKLNEDGDFRDASWSDVSVPLDLSNSTGSAQIYFDRAGLSNVGSFDMPDNPNVNKLLQPYSFRNFNVSVNPTSAGTISGTLSTPPTVSASPTVGSTSPTQIPSNQKFAPNVAVIVGVILGFGTLATIGAIILYFRYRRRRISDMKPPSVTPFSNTKDYKITRTDIKERKRQMIGQRERLERELEAYEQASQVSNSRTGTVPDDINGSNEEDEIIQVSRRQLGLLTQRIAALEAFTMAPPDYSSCTSG